MIIRKAIFSDLSEIIRLLYQDSLGKEREIYTLPPKICYIDAFNDINQDPNNFLIVMELNSKIIGTLQLIMISSISFQGGKRAQIESVRIDQTYRNKGFGKKLIQWSIQEAKKNNCKWIQLTSHKKRIDALNFYQSLGFIPTHEGLKLDLKTSDD